MCYCDPSKRTPWCGKPSCRQIDVQFVIPDGHSAFLAHMDQLTNLIDGARAAVRRGEATPKILHAYADEMEAALVAAREARDGK